MQLISVNTGLPREVTWHGRNVTTAIYKESVRGRIALRKSNLDGDRQADLGVHGGEYKAVYCYPLAHYAYWKRELPGRELPMGIFEENLTIDGLLEESVHLGDQFSIGSARGRNRRGRQDCGDRPRAEWSPCLGDHPTLYGKWYGDDDVAAVRRALRVAALSESCKEYFRERREKIPTSD